MSAQRGGGVSTSDDLHWKKLKQDFVDFFIFHLLSLIGTLSQDTNNSNHDILRSNIQGKKLLWEVRDIQEYFNLRQSDYQIEL